VTRHAETIVLVDDEPVLLRTFARLLRGCAGTIESFTSAADAVERVKRGGVEVVVSDISMPGMDGIELLRKIREHDPDLPVVLISGDPDGARVAGIAEREAFKCVLKPMDNQELRMTVQKAAKLHTFARARRHAFGSDPGDSVSDQERRAASFERALEGLWMAFQPVVRAFDQSIIGYEALLRSNEALLPSPAHLLRTAESLGQITRLGRTVRRAVEPFALDRPMSALFLNVHPLELADPDLLNRASPLVHHAAGVVLEVSERALLDDRGITRKTLEALRECGFRIALDGLGPESAGLTGFAMLEPEFVKLDMTLVRDIDESPGKQQLVGAITALSKDIGASIIAEGVETDAERQTLVELGCELLQGYLFARPARVLPEPSWEGTGFGPVRSDFPLGSDIPVSGTHLIPNDSQPALSIDHSDARPKRLRMG
jgi:EAL domain-containing protein (putative c-di-GMP-specific phosphodiesterase class I)